MRPPASGAEVPHAVEWRGVGWASRGAARRAKKFGSAMEPVGESVVDGADEIAGPLPPLTGDVVYEFAEKTKGRPAKGRPFSFVRFTGWGGR